MKHSEIPARNSRIRAENAADVSIARLATEHNLTPRQVHRILSTGTHGRGRPPRSRVLDAGELRTYRKLRALIGIEATRAEMKL